MARRRTRRKSRSRSRRTPQVSLLGLAQGMIVGNAVTQMTMGVGIVPFFTRGWADNELTNNNPSDQLYLSEIVKGQTQLRAGNTADSFGKLLSLNLQKYGVMGIGTLVLAGPAFKLFRRGISPLSRPVNRLLGKTSPIKV